MRKIYYPWLAALLAAFVVAPAALAAVPADLEKAFANPPEAAKPGVLWMWMGCNLSKAGITRDLEALKAAGFNRTTVFSLADVTTPWAGEIQNSPTTEIISWTEPWWQMVRHAALEISLVKNLKPEVLPCLTQWLQNVHQRWPDAQVVTQGEFGEAWRREHPDHKSLDYKFVQRGTGIGGSEPNLEIRWFMNTDFRLAILRDWQKDDPGKVIDFTRYDLPAREPADPTADKPTRNWSLINRINQKHRRTEDAPVLLQDLTQEEQALIKKRYPELF